MKDFNIPLIYKSTLITQIKALRDMKDRNRRDMSPTVLDFGSVEFLLARHFGFCYGVKNAIELSYKAIEENPERRIFLLSEMIHNPEVNADIKSRGVEFIFEPDGRQVIEWNELSKDDIIMIPAFGITIETETKLKNIGIEILKYNTTCPFVEKVWNRAYSLGTNGFSVVVHGKYKHEETKATYSHSKMNAPTIIVFNLEEAKIIGRYILGEISKEYFFEFFKNKLSDGFDPDRDLQKLGVVNQTTMLATETQAISDYLYDIMEEKYGSDSLAKHFADTRDTLCYATHDNQNATYALLAENADLAIVVGGYNSSNTSHIVDLCEQKVPTYFISSEDKIISRDKIKHYDLKQGREIVTENYIPAGKKPKIILTSGASCPDSIIEAVMKKAASFFENAKSEEEILSSLKMKYQNPDTDKN
jgi:4-hydroxy-3-methylbut-2-enyl diphosphate reductase